MQSNKDKIKFLLDVCSGMVNIYVHTTKLFVLSLI